MLNFGGLIIRVGFPLKGSIRATIRDIRVLEYRGLKNYLYYFGASLVKCIV